MGEMLASDRKSVQRGKPRALRSAALVAIVVAMLAFGTAGCMLPLLGAIPSVINLAHSALTSGSSPKDDAEAKNAEAAAPTVEADSPTDEAGKPPPKLTPGNLCQMMAIAHPDMVLVELRKNAARALPSTANFICRIPRTKRTGPRSSTAIRARAVGYRR